MPKCRNMDVNKAPPLTGHGERTVICAEANGEIGRHGIEASALENFDSENGGADGDDRPSDNGFAGAMRFISAANAAASSRRALYFVGGGAEVHFSRRIRDI